MKTLGLFFFSLDTKKFYAYNLNRVLSHRKKPSRRESPPNMATRKNYRIVHIPALQLVKNFNPPPPPFRNRKSHSNGETHTLRAGKISEGCLTEKGSVGPSVASRWSPKYLMCSFVLLRNWLGTGCGEKENKGNVARMRQKKNEMRWILGAEELKRGGGKDHYCVVGFLTPPSGRCFLQLCTSC